MTTTTVGDADKITILKLLAAGRDAGFVAAATRLDVDTVVRTASAHGYPDVAKMAWAVDVLTKDADAAARSSIPQGGRPAGRTVTLPAPPAVPLPTVPLPAPILTTPPAPPVPVRDDPVAQLLADAAASKRKRTRELGERAAKALDLVRAELRAETERDAAAAAREAAEAKIRAEVARLEKKLAELKSGLTKSAAVPAGAAAAGLDPKEVRRWAAANGVPCTTVGRVPRAILDAYEAAHGGAS